MIIIDKNTVAIWYLRTLETQDWMCAIREVEPDQKYEIIYRFRYYNDNKVFSSTDRKSWTEGVYQGSRASALEKMRTMAKIMEVVASGPLFELINEGDFEAFFRKFKNAPFAHTQEKKVGRA